ncbi:hypothetical protein M441DRAFT_83227 [Trichoderma asperellum CBS 433.97]|uniref:Uncharacterized protein n=1 Tax=Trichoderma asperellum (strain ATCC 204424 / CBS 433.97 / NBRC 101777) TaxID=1042311 RepID=A0A2T3YXQ0_TRIA4|nr:hypothetical protein M441DRAFT_83227 [Trichoderma asperellum CBS 433.97]PTB37343.1 hypothetical protein M441DRAFT_83227 [Trichoderma asperellum CBS 433.97]
MCLLFSYHVISCYIRQRERGCVKRPCSAVISGRDDGSQGSLELCPHSHMAAAAICTLPSPMLLLAQPAACPQHTRTSRHKPLRPEPGRRRRKGQGQGFTSSDHDAAQIRHQGDTSHHVVCVVTRASLLLCPLPNSTSAAQASQTMNHVPPRCPLEQQPSLCMLMSLRQKGHQVTSQRGSQAIRRLPAPCESRLGQGGENLEGQKKKRKKKDLRTANRARQRSLVRYQKKENKEACG